MNQTSVDDFTGTILSAWYAVASQWSPPGDDVGPCVGCARSPLADVLDIRDYPHDIIHSLAMPLVAAVDHVGISLAEEHVAPDSPTARQLVAASLVGRSEEIVDVLENCVRYRIDRYVTFELERTLLEFG